VYGVIVINGFQAELPQNNAIDVVPIAQDNDEENLGGRRIPLPIAL